MNCRTHSNPFEAQLRGGLEWLADGPDEGEQYAVNPPYQVSRRKTYADAKNAFKEITEMLKDETLSDEQRNTLNMHTARLAGVLHSPWLPYGWGRRLIMTGIMSLGVYGLFVGNYEVFVWWLLLPFFSPRITGTVLYFFGRFFGGLSRSL